MFELQLVLPLPRGLNRVKVPKYTMDCPVTAARSKVKLVRPVVSYSSNTLKLNVHHNRLKGERCGLAPAPQSRSSDPASPCRSESEVAAFRSP